MSVGIKIGFLLAVISIVACNSNTTELENKIEKLEAEVSNLESFKPGLGSMMNQIQIYHTKFYFAMQNENWELMQYVVHELEENFEEVVENHGTHDGVDIEDLASKTVLPVLEELEKEIKSERSAIVLKSFDNLTLACNTCHQASNHGFIRIKNPEGQTFLNQDFSKP